MIILFASPAVDASPVRALDQAPLFPPVIDPNDLLPANGGDGRAGFVVNGALPRQFFGVAVAMGDFTGDGRADLLSGFVPSAPPAIAPPSGVALVLGRSIVPMGPDGLETEPVFVNGNAAPDLLRLAIEDRTLFQGWLGWRTRTLGDLDGDGIDDFAFVTRGGRLGQSGGIVFVVYGTPEVGPNFANYLNLLPEFGGTGQTGFMLRGNQLPDFLGKDISGVGDINGDGWNDLLVLSDRQSEPDRLAGMAYLLYGQPGRNMPAETTLDELLAQDAARGFAILAPVPEGPTPGQMDSQFQGARLVPDLNGDGLDDIVLCRSRSQFANTLFNGECYVVFGRRGSAPFPPRFDLGDLLARNGGDGTLGFVIVGDRGSNLGSPDANGDRNSFGLDGIGDFDGDGFNDLLLAAPSGAGGGNAYLVFGQAGWPAEIDLRKGIDQARLLARITRFERFLTPPPDIVGFGASVGGAGDLNDDGLPDIAIIAEPPGSQDTGAWIVFGTRNPPEDFVVEALLPEHDGDGRRGFLVRNFGGPFGIKLGIGRSIASGDFNGDGIDDVAIGSPNADPSGLSNAGRVVVLYGRGPISREIPALGGVGLSVLVVLLLAVAVRRLRRSEN